eukprot:CAMPEP_0117537018 /NCGR_PEP_ID=MMETSP0784-20121206/41749_1 /TAXON_ID=39447 /ORGANISM="" /LENGTH=196 /DNA_ID=CAMNT_0005333593 /DNA_START=99 /DNA_END=689 /DNA_ORIENTATION=-
MFVAIARSPPRRRLRVACAAALAITFGISVQPICSRGAPAPGTGGGGGHAFVVARLPVAPNPGSRSAVSVKRSVSAALAPDATNPAEIVGIDSVEEFRERIAGDLALAMFSSPFCGPCLLVEPKITEIAEDFATAGLKVFKVSLTPGKTTKEVKALFTELKVTELPTFLVYKHGEVQGRVTGTRSAELRALVEELA